MRGSGPLATRFIAMHNTRRTKKSDFTITFTITPPDTN